MITINFFDYIQLDCFSPAIQKKTCNRGLKRSQRNKSTKIRVFSVRISTNLRYPSSISIYIYIYIYIYTSRRRSKQSKKIKLIDHCIDETVLLVLQG